MKKLTLILLMAVLAIPAMQAQMAASKAISNRNTTSRDYVIKTTPMHANEWGVRPASTMLKGEPTYMWDFETDASFEGWGAYDADGDDYTWGIDNSGENARSGVTCLVSDSYISGVGALDPDNWLISPDIPLNGTLSIWALNYSSYFADMFAVYVCVGELTSLDDFVLLQDNIVPPSTAWEEYTFDLSQFGGATGCFAIRHYDSYNMYHLFIDDISVVGPAVVAPEDLTVTSVTDVTADVTWVDNENNAWNLRYRPVVPGVENNLLWDFEEDTYGNTDLSLTGGWTSIDADGDGNDWYHLFGVAGLKTHSGTGHVTSASYDGNAALDPDNWLISPMVKLDGELSFWAASQDAGWLENIKVYVSTDMQNWQAISDDITVPGDITEYTFDLTGFEGVDGYVAIRHYNCEDNFRLNVDDIAITYVKEAEWIYVNDIDETNYTIEGLDPATTYEVQVQAMNNEGDASNWTPVAIFTTQEEQTLEPTISPSIQTWTGVWGDHTQYVKVEEAEDDCELQYRYKFEDGEWSDWMSYDEVLTFTEDGTYEVEARAKAPGKDWSEAVGVRFIITPRTGIDELTGNKNVAGVRYFNAMGQEMSQPSGLTIVVTTFTDGTSNAVKVMK